MFSKIIKFFTDILSKFSSTPGVVQPAVEVNVSIDTREEKVVAVKEESAPVEQPKEKVQPKAAPNRRPKKVSIPDTTEKKKPGPKPKDKQLVKIPVEQSSKPKSKKTPAK